MSFSPSPLLGGFPLVENRTFFCKETTLLFLFPFLFFFDVIPALKYVFPGSLSGCTLFPKMVFFFSLGISSALLSFLRGRSPHLSLSSRSRPFFFFQGAEARRVPRFSLPMTVKSRSFFPWKNRPLMDILPFPPLGPPRCPSSPVGGAIFLYTLPSSFLVGPPPLRPFTQCRHGSL